MPCRWLTVMSVSFGGVNDTRPRHKEKQQAEGCDFFAIIHLCNPFGML